MCLEDKGKKRRPTTSPNVLDTHTTARREKQKKNVGVWSPSQMADREEEEKPKK
jgi:hypothetical protein